MLNKKYSLKRNEGPECQAGTAQERQRGATPCPRPGAAAGNSNPRDITLPTKVHLVKAMVLPVVIYGCESWTVKKAEHRRIDAFELWC